MPLHGPHSGTGSEVFFFLVSLNFCDLHLSGLVPKPVFGHLTCFQYVLLVGILIFSRQDRWKLNMIVVLWWTQENVLQFGDETAGFHFRQSSLLPTVEKWHQCSFSVTQVSIVFFFCLYDFKTYPLSNKTHQTRSVLWTHNYGYIWLLLIWEENHWCSCDVTGAKAIKWRSHTVFHMPLFCWEFLQLRVQKRWLAANRGETEAPLWRPAVGLSGQISAGWNELRVETGDALQPNESASVTTSPALLQLKPFVMHDG